MIFKNIQNSKNTNISSFPAFVVFSKCKKIFLDVLNSWTFVRLKVVFFSTLTICLYILNIQKIQIIDILCQSPIFEVFYKIRELRIFLKFEK